MDARKGQGPGGRARPPSQPDTGGNVRRTDGDFGRYDTVRPSEPRARGHTLV